MKLTGQMVYDALAASVVNGEPRYDDAAGILYAKLFPNELMYTLDYNDEDSTLAGDLDELLSLIKENAIEGDYIDIYVQSKKDNEDIGHCQLYYMQDGKFLQVIESHSAAIGLDVTLSEMEKEARKISA